MHCAKYLLDRGDQVVRIENLNDYYAAKLKQARQNQLQGYERFTFYKTDLQNKDTIADIFAADSPARVIHLGAQAVCKILSIGVRLFMMTRIWTGDEYYMLCHKSYLSSVTRANKSV